MSTENKFLPKGFEPGFNDVLIGRCKRCYEHSGNKSFHIFVASRLNEYSKATSKMAKSKILASAVSEIQKKSPHAGFIKKDSETGLWFQVGEFLAREKTSQAFRDALHDGYKSSNSSRKKRRKTKKTDSASPDKLVQSNSLFEQQCGFVSETSSCNRTIVESGSSSIDSGSSDRRYRIEVFDKVILDEICHTDNINLDLHDFGLEEVDNISILKMEKIDNNDVLSTCSSLRFDNDKENDEFEIYNNDFKDNNLLQGKLFEEEVSEYSDIDLSYLYKKPQLSLFNSKMSKSASNTQNRNSNSSRSFVSIPRRNTSAAMTA